MEGFFLAPTTAMGWPEFGTENHRSPVGCFLVALTGPRYFSGCIAILFSSQYINFVLEHSTNGVSILVLFAAIYGTTWVAPLVALRLCCPDDRFRQTWRREVQFRARYILEIALEVAVAVVFVLKVLGPLAIRHWIGQETVATCSGAAQDFAWELAQFVRVWIRETIIMPYGQLLKVLLGNMHDPVRFPWFGGDSFNELCTHTRNMANNVTTFATIFPSFSLFGVVWMTTIISMMAFSLPFIRFGWPFDIPTEMILGDRISLPGPSWGPYCLLMWGLGVLLLLFAAPSGQ